MPLHSHSALLLYYKEAIDMSKNLFGRARAQLLVLSYCAFYANYGRIYRSFFFYHIIFLMITAFSQFYGKGQVI